MLGNLVVRHLVNRFHVGNVPLELLALDALLQLALGFARPENPDRVRILELPTRLGAFRIVFDWSDEPPVT